MGLQTDAVLAQNFAVLQAVCKRTSGCVIFRPPLHWLVYYILDPAPHVHLHVLVIFGVYLTIKEKQTTLSKEATVGKGRKGKGESSEEGDEKQYDGAWIYTKKVVFFLLLKF